MKYALAFAVVVVVISLWLVGCKQPEADYNGQKVTLSTLDNAIDSEVQKARYKVQDEFEAKMAEKERLEREFQNKIALIDVTHQAEITKLTNEFKSSSAEAKAMLEKILRDGTAAVETARSTGENTRNQLYAEYDRRTAGMSAVMQGVSMVPGAAPFSGLIQQALPYVLGVGGVGGVVYAKRKEDAAWEEAQQKKEKEMLERQQAADAAWSEAQQHMLLLLNNQLKTPASTN